MAQVKLTYFDLYGRGEIIRLLLKHAGIEFEDFRLPAPFVDPTEWMKLKPTIPSGQLPMLEWNGTKLSQSMAICRFIAKEANLAGKTSLETAAIDEMVDAVQDINNQWYNGQFETNEEKKKEMQENFNKVFLPEKLRMIEKRMTSSGGQFLAANALSWADIHFLQSALVLQKTDPEVLKDFPKLENLVKRVQDLPNLKKWIAERPDAPF
ncbi:glutathione S-transferase 1 [Eurytemora carolleeae]|uniref:glutathione S-transferase 1 n=1 Tax=Eurytemora carolleeae TaxID=1294199 RepID=UPI000C79005A|nr:glutathione S-transferase 1 [Eurytemora carolleeae]|eukprot:XP_023347867.1 glutathione S-transferase 1-like [Eurytemora affinis]